MTEQLRKSAKMAELPQTDDGKLPRTDRGRRTLRKLLDAAAAEFGERGFHETSISAITQRAGTAMGSFYTYFDSKEALFRALVADMSGRVRDHVAPALADTRGTLDAERAALTAFLGFVADHKEVYRIIDEAEFVDADSFRTHYRTTVERIAARLADGAARGEVRGDIDEIDAWAIMGMNVFLGLRFGVWRCDGDPDAARVAAHANRLIADGLKRG